MRELAFLNKGINLILVDQKMLKKKKYENKFDGGIFEFVQFINQKKPILHLIKMKNQFLKNQYIFLQIKNNVRRRVFIRMERWLF